YAYPRGRAGMRFAVPRRSQPHTFDEGDLGLEAELATRLIDRAAVLRPEEGNAEARHRWTPLRPRNHRHALGHAAGRVQRPVGEVDVPRASADLASDRVGELALREGRVVRDVVGLTDRARMLQREHERRDDIRDVDERQGIVA